MIALKRRWQTAKASSALFPIGTNAFPTRIFTNNCICEDSGTTDGRCQSFRWDLFLLHASPVEDISPRHMCAPGLSYTIKAVACQTGKQCSTFASVLRSMGRNFAFLGGKGTKIFYRVWGQNPIIRARLQQKVKQAQFSIKIALLNTKATFITFSL